MIEELLAELDPPATVRWWADLVDDDFTAFLDRRRPYLAVDTETTGLGWGDTVRTVQVGDELEAWVIPACRPDVVLRALRSRWLLAWNVAFDASHLARFLRLPFEALVARFRDTSVLAGLVDPRARYQGGVGRSLKEWARHVCGVAGDLYDRQRADMFRKEKVDWAGVDPQHPTMLRYAGSDPVLTYRVHRHLAELVANRVDTVRREQELMRVLAVMRHRGIALDAERASQAQAGYLAGEQQLLEQLEPCGIDSVFKRDQVIAALQAEGFERALIKRTGGGEVCVDRFVLAALANAGSKVAAAVYDAKRQHRFAGYCAKFIDAGAYDGRVHASINGIGAKTRRMSVSQPPLQQVPKKEVALRSMFAPAAGRVIVRADYSSMELRYMAGLSGDPELISDITESVAIFEELGVFVFGVPASDEEAAWQRNTAKTAVYAMCYGAGPRKIAEASGITFTAAEQLCNAWRHRYGVLQTCFNDAMDQIANEGGVELPRSGWLPSDPERPYVGLNLLVQGGCRDEFVDRILALVEVGLEAAIVLPYHDEVVGEVDAGDVDEVAHLLQTVMPITTMAVPIPVEATSGETWGAAYVKATAVSYALDEVDEDDQDDEDEPA